jgi:hypothetical protein
VDEFIPETAIELLPVGQHLEEIGIDHRFENTRVLTEIGREPGGGAANARQQVQQMRVRIEHRKKLDARRETGEEPVETIESRVRIGGARQRAQQRRHEARQKLARTRRARGGETAGMPAANGFRHFRCLAEAELAQCLQRVGVVLRTGEDETAPLLAQGRRGLEQFRIVIADTFEAFRQRFSKRVPAFECHETGNAVEIRIGRRQRVRLLVIDHLETMFERAKKTIGLLQFFRRPGCDPFLCGELIQHETGLLATQIVVAATRDQLLGLHEEFDFANAAPSELDVVTGHRNDTMAADGVDLALHGMNVVDGGEVEVPAPDVGRQRFQQALARGNIAGDGACLDEGGALPVLAAALVVAFGGGKRDSDGRTAGIGAEAEVGSEDIALRRPLLKHLHEILREPHEELAVIEPVLQGKLPRLVEDDEIDVARIVEFAGAVFAHPEDDEARSFRRHFLRRPQHLPARCGVSQKPEDGTFDGAVGKGRERLRHLLELPGAGDVGHCDQERGFRLRKAKRRHDIRLLVEIARGMDPGQEIGKRFARRALEKARQPVGVKPENAAKKRGVAEQ